eukprot:974770-Pleurochrysis_carterae.AAC.1
MGGEKNIDWRQEPIGMNEDSCCSGGDVLRAQVACVKLPPATAEVPLTAACHYVPGAKRLP